MQCKEFDCDTENCRYWREEEGCQRTTITIQEGHCCEFEEKHKVCIFVENGMVSAVCSDLSRDDISVEIFDLDDAQREASSRVDEMRAMRHSLSKVFYTIYE